MTAPVPYESRVRPLIAAATPAPWVAGSTYDSENAFEERGYHLSAISQLDGPMLYASTEFTAPGGVRDPKVRIANAALVVTAVNAAAASADLAEAVRALLARLAFDTLNPDSVDAGGKVVEALNRLDAAGGA